MVEIIYKNRNYVIINKPAGVPSQSDASGDKDALTLTEEALSAVGEGDKLWLVHRLDRTVGGLMVFARNRQYAATLSELVRDKEISKEYLAVVDGVCDGGVMEDMLYKDARVGKAFVADSGKKGAKRARLTYRALGTVSTQRGEKTLVAVTLDTGRFHQIRAQFSSRGLPLCRDAKYGSKDKSGRDIALFAFRLTLPIGEGESYSAMPPVKEYPWCLFDNDLYGSV